VLQAALLLWSLCCSVELSTVKRWIGSSFAFFAWLLGWKNANVLPIALAIYFQVLLIVFDL
jgi:hypothetical protein